MHRLLSLLLIFLFACGNSSKLNGNNIIAQKNKDVLILSLLTKNHLVQTHSRSPELNELLLNDSSKRIINSFKSLELKYFGGHISVYYLFSNARQQAVELTAEEEKLLNTLQWTSKKTIKGYDGEIQFDYGERAYRIKKIIAKNE